MNDETKLLKESEEKYRGLYESIPNLVVFTDMEGKIQDCNGRCVDFLGYSKDEMRHVSYQQLTPSKWHRIEEDIVVNQIMVKGYSDVYEKEYIRKDGTAFPISLQTWLIKDDQGEPKGMWAIIQDITEMKKAEEKLRNLTKAVEQSPVSIVITNLHGDIEYANPKVSATTGYTLEELHGINLRILKSGETPPEEYKLLWDTITKGETWKGTFHNKRKDGSLYWEYCEIGPITDAQGKIVNYIALKQDITEAKKIEEEVSNLALRYQTILQTANDGIHVVDFDGKLIEANDAFCKMLGYSYEELLHMSVADWDAQWKGEELMEKVKEVSFSPSVFETRHRKKDGSIIDVEIKTSHVILNSTSYQCATARDITKRKQIELEIKSKNEELHKLNAEKDKFFSIIAHDLRSPFNFLLGFTELMSDDAQNFSLDEMKIFSKELNQSAHHTFDLLEDLLAWARMERGLTEYNPQNVRLKTAINESLYILAESARSKSIELSVEVPDDLDILADPSMLQVIIRNLTSNAIKFTKNGGAIWISSTKDNDAVSITIRDSGIGMSDEIRQNLFRMDVNTKRKGTAGESSSGLGLLLCKEFVEKHGGEISVMSSINEGSTFTFSIPAGS